MDFKAIGKKEVLLTQVYHQRALKSLKIQITEPKPEKLKIVTEKEWEDLNNRLKELEILALGHKPTQPPSISHPVLAINIEDPLNSDSLNSSKELIKALTKELISSAYK